jgi:putative SOS response-associated peptidase YedK
MDGYYEWEKIDGRKVPYFLHRDHDLLAFAGLYELWPDPDRAEDDPDRWLFSYTILTHPAPTRSDTSTTGHRCSCRRESYARGGSTRP